MLKRLLIANRGEIACRVIRTAQRMDIHTVAIFSEQDANALHVLLSDEAVALGLGDPMGYLNIARIIEIALAARVEAIHPGYGFLSESAAFAEACVQAGLVFIGPSAAVIASMGDKRQAKIMLEQAGLPMIPGYHGDDQSVGALSRAAEVLGYPVLLKAAFGGGGRGLRQVKAPDQIQQAIESAQREAQSYFLDGTLFIEKYFESARHIELQVLVDVQGQQRYLFDRDCSVQRRYQKMIEEAPAPYLSDRARAAMRKAAKTIFSQLPYLGVATIEFLVDEQDQVYFMEMNTRLQVEHPVTEMITQLDLVEWQLRLAAGEAMPFEQEDVSLQGHAIEARLYAEDPSQEFMPSTGVLTHFVLPSGYEWLRVDTGLAQNDSMGPYYDALLAKVVVQGRNRDEAISRLSQALCATQVVGVETNRALLLAICAAEPFLKGPSTTALIEQNPSLCHGQSLNVPSPLLALAGVCYLQWLNQQAALAAEASNTPDSPWFGRHYWHLAARGRSIFKLWSAQKAIELTVLPRAADYVVEVGEEQADTVQIEFQEGKTLTAVVDEKQMSITVFLHQDTIHLFYQAAHYRMGTRQPSITRTHRGSRSKSDIMATMPGCVIDIAVQPSQRVLRGDRILTIEAMKMEHAIFSPVDGVVQVLHVSLGDHVQGGALLVELSCR